MSEIEVLVAENLKRVKEFIEKDWPKYDKGDLGYLDQESAWQLG